MSERVEWNSNLTFLLAMIGAAVGLGNIWRFPYVFFSNGQGAFLIPYIIAILVLGLPFMLLEYSLGAKYNTSVLNTFKKVGDKYQYVGWAIMIISFLIVCYYLTIVCWDLNYFVFSFTKAWGTDPNAFFNSFLQSSPTPSFSGLTTIIPYIFVAVLILWAVTWLISHGDINKGIGNFTTIFVPLLFVLGIGIAIYNMTLPGAWIGYMRFFQPDWSLLLNLDMWLAAFGQILFTLSLGIGVVLSYSSHLPVGKSNLTKNACIVILANCGFEIINALGVFSVLGYMSYTTGVAFNSLVTQGTGLAFIVFPQVFNILGGPGLILGIAFFFCILIAGITTSISYLEPLADSISMKFALSRKKSVSILCIVGFLISVIFTTGVGNFLITAFDTSLNNIALILLVLIQCLIFGYILGPEPLMEALNVNTLFKVGNWWKYIIKYILPIVLVIIWILGVIDTLQGADTASIVVYAIVIGIVLVSSYILYRVKGKGEEING